MATKTPTKQIVVRVKLATHKKIRKRALEAEHSMGKEAADIIENALSATVKRSPANP